MSTLHALKLVLVLSLTQTIHAATATLLTEDNIVVSIETSSRPSSQNPSRIQKIRISWGEKEQAFTPTCFGEVQVMSLEAPEPIMFRPCGAFAIPSSKEGHVLTAFQTTGEESVIIFNRSGKCQRFDFNSSTTSKLLHSSNGEAQYTFQASGGPDSRVHVHLLAGKADSSSGRPPIDTVRIALGKSDPIEIRSSILRKLMNVSYEPATFPDGSCEYQGGVSAVRALSGASVLLRLAGLYEDEPQYLYLLVRSDKEALFFYRGVSDRIREGAEEEDS